MANISFGWTTHAFCNRAKNVTRREWQPDYAATMKKGSQHNAFDRSPRFGGKQIGIIRLTETPYLEDMTDMPSEDFAGEGFEFYDKYPQFTPKKFQKEFHEMGISTFREYFDICKNWGGGELYVVRFEIVLLSSNANLYKISE